MKAAIFVCIALALSDIVPAQGQVVDDGPLSLTPYIERGQLQKARDLSRVHAEAFGIDVHSHSAFLTVGPTNNIHYHFWYLRALENYEDAPFVVYMNGGPGSSSLVGLFYLVGPYYITRDGSIKWRSPETNWLTRYNLVFLDVLAGAGFSYSTSRQNLPNTTESVSHSVLQALDQFFVLFPPNAQQEVYLATVGYSSKFAIGVTQLMTTLRRQHSFKVTGLILESAYIDALIQVRPVEFLYQTGMITAVGRRVLEEQLQKFRALMNSHQYVRASRLLLEFDEAILQNTHSVLNVESGIEDSGTILQDTSKHPLGPISSLIARSPGLKRALHVGVNTPFYEFNAQVREGFVISGDFAQSGKRQLEQVLDANVKVLYFTGNMDVIIPAGPARDIAQDLQWQCTKEYNQITNRQIWRDDDANSAGYVKCACNLCKGTVRNAGHYVISDEPYRAFDLVDRFVSNRGFGQYVVYPPTSD